MQWIAGYRPVHGISSGISYIYPGTSGLNAFGPRIRSRLADATRKDSIRWSEPCIVLPGHSLMVTCSQPVSDNRAGRIGVVGTDLTIDTINRNSIGTQVGNHGYAILSLRGFM
jgi:phosphoserine phosphatase RsbU/P